MYRILFIDDHLDILEANRSYFAEQGFLAAVCSSSKEAVSMLQTQSFDCIVLDVWMPGMDGYEACRAIRRWCNTPVIFLSCLDQPDHKISGLMLGEDAYMTKPYDLRELHAQVTACLRREHTPPLSRPPSNPFPDDFAINREQRIVRLCKHICVLSKKEMSLLSLLLEHPDITLDKECLCSAMMLLTIMPPL